jgi:hypothetical protein
MPSLQHPRGWLDIQYLANGTKMTSVPTITAIGMENTMHKTVILMFEKRLEH